jgi:hypothetical protein
MPRLVIRIFITCIFVAFITVLFFFIENKSNVPSYIAIPILVSLLTKYVLGDWDKGFKRTIFDIPYWITIFSLSFAICYLLTCIHSSKN